MATCTQETKPSVYECHPAANIFPMMDNESFAALKADIKANGLKTAGKLYFNQVLDGRNRYKACQELGIEMEFWELDESDETFDPVAYVLSHNLHRRHLTESQRAVIAGKLAKLKVGGDRGNQHTGGKGQICPLPTLEQAADMLNVGRRSVVSAKQVLDAGSPEIIQAVEAGQLPVSFAAKFVTEEDDKRTQSKLWKQGGKEALKHHITASSNFVENDTAEPAVDSDDDQAEKIAQKAIAVLERIRNRPLRSTAIERVKAWIENEASKPIADSPKPASPKSKSASSESPGALSKMDKVKEREAKVRAFKRKAIDWMTDHQPCSERDFCRWATENLPPIPRGQTKDTYPGYMLRTIGTLNVKDGVFRLRAKYQEAVTA